MTLRKTFDIIFSSKTRKKNKMKEMTVCELIDELKKFDDKTIINVEDCDGYAFPIKIVKRENALVITYDIESRNDY